MPKALPPTAVNRIGRLAAEVRGQQKLPLDQTLGPVQPPDTGRAACPVDAAAQSIRLSAG